MGSSARPERRTLLGDALGGAYGDTLRTVTGAPARGYGPLPGNDPTLMGQHAPVPTSVGIHGIGTSNRILVSPALLENANPYHERQGGTATLDGVMGHEHGHELDRRNGALASEFGRRYDGHHSTDAYADSDGREKFAATFNASVQMLRDAAQMSDADAIRAVGDRYERDYPGTAFLADYLLAQPLYAKHPARAVFGTDEGRAFAQSHPLGESRVPWGEVMQAFGLAPKEDHPHLTRYGLTPKGTP